jgi:hypothetical protein
MRLVDDEHHGAVPFGGLGGEQVRGLGHQLGFEVARLGAERPDHLHVKPAGAEGGVGDVDDLVPGGVQPGDGGAGGHGLPGADRTGDRLQHLREVLPRAISVTAVTHPLHGRTLHAVAFIHLRGVLHLVVRLPDSSPGTVPASATDVFGGQASAGPAVVLDADGLRRLRALVMALAAGNGRAR